MNEPEPNPYAPPKASLQSEQATGDHLAPYLENLVFPLKFTFRVFTLSPRMDVVDATGRSVLHAKQKLFKFKEHIEIFTDSTQKTKLADIRADRIIDWSARYGFIDTEGGRIGSVGRKGWRSIWRANYEVFNPGDMTTDFTISEENPFAKFIDGMVGQIPLIGLLTLYLFHPRYIANRTGGQGVLRMHKLPAFLQGKFSIESLGDITPRETMNLLLAFIMVTMLERRRG
jgi:hypothetical protein